MEDSDPVRPLKEPPTITGKFAEDLVGRVETTKGVPNELKTGW